MEAVKVWLAKWWGVVASVGALIFIYIFNSRGKTIEHLKAELDLSKATKVLESLKSQERQDTKAYEDALARYNDLKRKLSGS